MIEEIPEKGLIKYAKPVGVVAAITPSTNPSATPVNKAMMALKGGNAIIIAPPPTAWEATKPTVDGMRRELEKIGLPADLVQILPSPVTRTMTTELMERADLVVVTGSQVNVRQAYKSGKPAIGVGVGQCAGHHRRDGGPRRRCAQDHGVENLRPRNVVLVGKRHCCRRSDLRSGHRRARGRRAAIWPVLPSGRASSSGCGWTASSTVP